LKPRRSGTSIGANVTEGNRAQSKSDFVHRLSVALKGADETEYWRNILRDGDVITGQQAEVTIGRLRGAGKNADFIDQDSEEQLGSLLAISL
jgi:four helix bundle protein